jgi:serine/threonine-protein kinase HipA
VHTVQRRPNPCGSKDAERGSYPEIVDAPTQHGAEAKADAHALYRRVVFNVMISNVDDHLRNHGFLWRNKAGWLLSGPWQALIAPNDSATFALVSRRASEMRTQ